MFFYRILMIISIILGLSACKISSSPNDEASQVIDFTPGKTVDFTFQSNELRLSGLFDVPAQQNPQALILFIHGYGETNIREWDMYADLRERLTSIGIATALWDKPGQGQSQGIFNINQSVEESASEVLDAAKYLRQVKAPGAHKIGIWGISRAGWIAPIALSQDHDLKFWISVSGVSAEDNFPYLLLSNLPYEGSSLQQSITLKKEWQQGCKILRTGGAYKTYLDATHQLRTNSYIRQMHGNGLTRAQYTAHQKTCQSGSCPRLDDTMCAYIFVEKFEDILSSLKIPTLALFGEKDLNIDWRKTQKLYRQTIGKNPEASLTIKVFADTDHNMNISKTGSLREMTQTPSPRKSPKYYDTQISWLKTHVLKLENYQR